ncbi:Oxysterol binding protein (Osh1), putative [Penicillium digitatum PHI26]|uniref:Oxysterol binding protein (Osh1), putative n=2 Tax=Penicillium digitatum TaxID=36651 RepID=K9G495_PEND2|nr:Oxysterol binding protein (Osh1), putative [Penicillium digitatum Pd1]EKV11346.1 Oxysterol binding protein (Osh1), putative [Penicillium digitatum Pd1]EKV16775.1 Oxysterol binding protein (Osh1), putative [Penicillium digitatum PHI26]
MVAFAHVALPSQLSAVARHSVSLCRHIHSSPFRSAIAHPITAHGPPPKAPATPSVEFKERLNSSDAELPVSEGEASRHKLTAALKKRFWKDVHVHGKSDEYQILLDKRPVRTPAKEVLSIPSTKPHLAYAVALEWDVMASAQQALKSHLIPMTSLAARATDIAREDAEGNGTTRKQIITTAMRYLDTDTLLCWEPERQRHALERTTADGEPIESLRQIQMRVAGTVMSFLSTKVWPGLEIIPILDTNSILPLSQPKGTKDTICTWVSELSAYDLAGLERAILASKSLLIAVRLVVEWSENFRHIQRPEVKKFGIEEAAEASSLEVTWQTKMWGEVEDTHDVGKEDLKRQLGSVVILSRGEDRDPDDNGDTNSVASASSSPGSLKHTRSSSRHSRRKQGQDSSPPPAIQESAEDMDAVEDLPSLNQVETDSTSLEQSVRTFRLFEILRSGDTTAIFNAIKETTDPQGVSSLNGTTVLHLALQCAEPQVVEYVLSAAEDLDINSRDRDGNTPLHIAAQLGRGPLVRELLNRLSINDAIVNYRGQTALDLARTPEIFQQLQLARSLFIDTKNQEIQALIGHSDYKGLEALLEEPRVEGIMDVNSYDLVTDPTTAHFGGTLLHEGARNKDTQLIEILLTHGADPFRRDKKGKLPQDVTKDDKIRALLRRSPAAVIAQRGIQERAILGNSNAQGLAGRGSVGDAPLAGKDAREMRGYLKKWTNYTTGYKLRWFVLEDGVLSYYKHQDDAGSACRGAINMKIARLSMDAQDKTRFEIHGKSSVKYHLKANHVVEAKRWFWSLNNAIQWAKDEAKEEERQRSKNAEVLRQAKMDQTEGRPTDAPSESGLSHKPSTKGLAAPSLGGGSNSGTRLSKYTSRTTLDTAAGDEDSSAYGGSYDQVLAPNDMNRAICHITSAPDGEGEDEEFIDYGSSHENEMPAADKDALNITAQSARLQLDLLANVAASLQAEKSRNPEMTIADPALEQALRAYEAAVSSLKDLVQNLLKISRDRDSYWQSRLSREESIRQMWEESMARVAREHEELQSKMGESEEKRKRTKRALKEALESAAGSSRSIAGGTPRLVTDSQNLEVSQTEAGVTETMNEADQSTHQLSTIPALSRNPSTYSKLSSLCGSESDGEEFFDAIDAGEIEVEDFNNAEENDTKQPKDESAELRAVKSIIIAPSFKGYEDPVRERLKMDADDRPKVSLWSILKSMIGKDMTKMTLPVSFNEPTSLLQRVAEDLEYTDLLDIAAGRTDSMERLVYVASYAASEYASTIGRVAKPFNPLLGETFEYVRPDKGYRFFVEQVSHHPPIGAAWAESPKWDYWGESSLKSKFYGKSFDINLLGTWFLKLRPSSGGEELYTWKKVTSSVIGIITGNPTVDNYGLMEIKNWTTGEICYLDFKPRGWKASSAYQVTGKVVDSKGSPKWSIGGRWNDKIYARHTPGFEAPVSGQDPESAKTFLVWQAHARPTGVPFNLTPFVITLNALPESLREWLPPTDTRLRPDQRAMEDGKYDMAAEEKHRVEEKQRAKRRERDTNGEVYAPQWFIRDKCPVTGEEFWAHNGKYWESRDAQDWSRSEDIF